MLGNTLTIDACCSVIGMEPDEFHFRRNDRTPEQLKDEAATLRSASLHSFACSVFEIDVVVLWDPLWISFARAEALNSLMAAASL